MSSTAVQGALWHESLPVVMRRSSLGPSRTLTTALNRYAFPWREWKLCTHTSMLLRWQ